MKLISSLFYLILILSILKCSEKKSLQIELKSLVEAEKSFALKSETIGIKDAFQTFLADEAIVFRPKPVLGKPVYENYTNGPKMLMWYPAFADISNAGDMGYTTGPWEYRKDGNSANADIFGHYISVWRKNENNEWHVLTDIGINHPKANPEIPPIDLYDSIYEIEYSELPIIDVQKGKSILFKVDQEFSQLSKTTGIVNAYKNYAANKIRLYRNASLPTTGKQYIEEVLSSTPGMTTWLPSNANISQSGDLGYTYGLGEINNNDKLDKFSYFRIWKMYQQDKWKLVLDVLLTIDDVE